LHNNEKEVDARGALFKQQFQSCDLDGGRQLQDHFMIQTVAERDIFLTLVIK